jgi:UDP-3-O-[3-hydroxymyristoyl] glucosamine N-acyltransferase
LPTADPDCVRRFRFNLSTFGFTITVGMGNDTHRIAIGDLAKQLGLDLDGDGSVTVSKVAPLDRADGSSLGFFADRKLRATLETTRAAAVILAPEYRPLCPAPALLTDNPYLAYAKAAGLMHPAPAPAVGVHPSAVVAADALIDPTASVGPLCVVEAGVEIGPRSVLGAGCVVQRDCRIGADCALVAQVTLCHGSWLGDRVLIHPGAVIGRDGFGFAKDGERWIRMPQLGVTRLGNDVEIGAGTAVDRGALDDTVIEDGVKIDNLVQIGHNVRIGEHTAMAACSGISGSTRIGRNCTVAGAVGMAGHLDIADDVHFTGMAMVIRSVAEPGVYSSGIPAMTNADWRRNAARFRHLDSIAKRLNRLEQAVSELPSGADPQTP